MIAQEIKHYTGIDVEHVESPSLSKLNPGKIHRIHIRGLVPTENEIDGIEEVFTRQYEDYALRKVTRFISPQVVTLEFCHVASRV